MGCKEEIFYNKGGKTLEQTIQRGSGGPIPGIIQGQALRCSEQPGLVEDIPVYFRVFGLDGL